MPLTLEDRLELLELPGRYGDIIDDRAWDRLDRIFTADARFGSPGAGEMVGIEAIKRFMAHPKTQHPGGHMMMNIYIDETADGVQLRTRAIFPDVAETGPLDTSSQVRYGSYYDTVVKTAAGWRVCKRIFSRQRLPG